LVGARHDLALGASGLQTRHHLAGVLLHALDHVRGAEPLLDRLVEDVADAVAAALLAAPARPVFGLGRLRRGGGLGGRLAATGAAGSAVRPLAGAAVVLGLGGGGLL